jgi:hypothetical protein
MAKNKDDKRLIQDFRLRQSRQFFAIAVTLILLVFLTLIYKRPDIFGNVPRDIIFAAQVMSIAAFVGFSSFNWRCPSCKKYLGADINRSICRRCRTRLQ